MANAEKSAIEPLMTEEQAADALNVRRHALRKMRVAGTGPKFIVVGKTRVRYSPSAIRTWRAEREVSSMAEFYASNCDGAQEAAKQREAAAHARKTRHPLKGAESVTP